MLKYLLITGSIVFAVNGHAMHSSLKEMYEGGGVEKLKNEFKTIRMQNLPKISSFGEKMKKR